MPNNIYKRFFILIITVLLAVITFIVIINNRLRNDTIRMRVEEKRKQEVLLNVAVDVVGKVMRSWLYDNTYWDEMVKFISTKDADWARVNIEEPLPIAKIDVAWVFDAKLNNIYSYNVLQNANISAIPFSYIEKEQIFNKEKLLNKEYPHFFYQTNEGVFEALLMPIQPSSDIERKAEPFGYMMVARLWSNKLFREFQNITFSDIKVLPPELTKLSEQKVNLSEVTVCNKIELKNFHGERIAYLFSSYNSKSLQELVKSSAQNIPIVLISVLLIVGAVIIALFFWVIRPLEIVSKSLLSENENLLKPIRNKSTEFGLIANLIHQFFEQRTSLRKEITSRSEVEKELREIKNQLEDKVEERTADLVIAKEKAEEANKLKSVFLTNMSHELRTPLFGIIGNADLLMESKDDSTQKLAESIHRSGERLKRTLNHLLDLAKLEADKIELDFEEYLINETVEKIVEFYREEAENKGLKLLLALPEEAIIAKVDIKLFEDAINNLVQNAIKFTFTGEVLVSLSFTEKEYLVSIKDTGIGIPQKNLEMIFDQFRQASEGIGRSYEGSGLGLALTKTYIKLLGGTMIVFSEVGTGSEFSVKLPIKNIVNTKSNNNSFDSTNECSSKNSKAIRNELPVLLVEDDRITQEVIKLFLHGMVDVDLAINAEEALSKVQENEYLAVLMDINLGRGLNGIHVTKEIRKLPGRKKLPIVAQTAFAMKGDKEEFMNAGCDYYLAKPFSKEELRNILEQIHDGYKA